MSATSVNVDTFQQDVLESSRPVLVDFYADWCGPCQAIKPVLDELVDDYAGRVDIKKLDIDQNQSLAVQYGVRSIPTLLLFKDGEVKETLIGLQSRTDLVSALDRAA